MTGRKEGIRLKWKILFEYKFTREIFLKTGSYKSLVPHCLVNIWNILKTVLNRREPLAIIWRGGFERLMYFSYSIPTLISISWPGTFTKSFTIINKTFVTGWYDATRPSDKPWKISLKSTKLKSPSPSLCCWSTATLSRGRAWSQILSFICNLRRINVNTYFFCCLAPIPRGRHLWKATIPNTC